MAVREGILALLVRGPRYGYQLKTEFESATGGVWDLNVGQVYSTLDRLARDGFVVVDEVDDQKRYDLTASGREELAAWWANLPLSEPPPRDDLILKVLLAVETDPERALDIVTSHRTALIQLLQLRRRDARAGTADLATTLAADAFAVRAEADLRWLDLCEQRILDRSRSINGSPLTPSS